MKSLVAALALFAAAPSVAQTPAPPPWRIEQPAPDRTRGVKVLLMYDMEGVSGVDKASSFLFGEPEYEQARRLLAADINAVAAGLFAGGATEVELVDAHGSGNPEPDMPTALLDPRIKWVTRKQRFDPYVDLSEPGAYDAVAVVGMHCKTGSRGFAAHTYTVGAAIELGGSSLTETEIVGLSFGQVGTPVIFAAGDDRLQADLATMPWLKYVRVKDSIDSATVRLRPLDAVHAEMKAKAAAAVRDLKHARTMVMTPTRVTVRATSPASLTLLEGFPGLDYHDNAVSYSAADFHTAYRSALPIIRVMVSAFSNVMLEAGAQAPNAAELRKQGRALLVSRWLEVEAGKAPPPPPPPPARDEHGVH